MQLNREKLFIPLSIAVISLAFIVIGSLLANLIMAVRKSGNDPPNVHKNDQEHLVMIENHSTTRKFEEKEEKSRNFMEKIVETTTKTPETTQKIRKICKTRECFTIAHQLLNWKNEQVNPCDDFYEYSCGRYAEVEDSKWGAMGQKGETIRETLREYFITKTPSSTSIAEKTVKTVFEKCMNQKENETEFKRNFEDLYADIQKIGNFPIFDKNWTDSSFDLNQILENMAKMHFMSFGFFSIYTESKELLIIPDIDQSKMTEGRFQRYIATLLAMKYKNMTEQEGDAVMKDIRKAISVQEAIMEIQPNMTELKNVTYTNYTILNSKFPQIDFDRVIKATMSPKNGNWEKLKMNYKGALNISFFFDDNENIGTVMKGFSKRELANFLLLQFIQQSTFSSKDYSGCETVVMQTLPQATLQVFVRNFFKKDNLDTASHLVEELKKSYIETFRKSPWLDEKTRKKAIQKVESMGKVIGYPEEFEAPGTLDAIFEEMLDIHPDDSFYVMNRKISRFQTEQSINFATFGGNIEPNEDLLQVNAFYNPGQNFLIMSVPFMDDPFFDPSFPLAVIMAKAGNILGHEIGHGFDNNGRLRDEKGEENDWWTSENAQEYERRVGCLRKQFDDYDDRVYGKKLNNDTVIGEIIADTLGHDISWMTYSKMNSSTESVGIVGLEDVPDDQLFFQMSAQIWCKYRSQAPLDVVQGQAHPPGVFRVNGALSNMKSFAETFNCPVGSPMNPKDKCEIF